jgi:hypothetical protein
MSRPHIPLKDKLVVWCRTLGPKHEIVCQKLCNYLEAKANKNGDGQDSEPPPWRHYPYGDIRHYLNNR